MWPLGVLKRKETKTVLLMPFSQASQFDDLSQFNHLFTQQFGTRSIVADVDSSTGYAARFQGALMNTPHSTALELGNTDFTIEFFIKQNVNSTNRGILGVRTATTNQGSFMVRSYTFNGVAMEYQKTSGAAYSTLVTDGSVNLTVGVRYHVAFVRQGTVLKVYIGGVLKGTQTIDNQFWNGTAPFGIGSYDSSTPSALMTDFQLDNLRIRKEAVYLSDFTPPTAPFTE